MEYQGVIRLKNICIGEVVLINEYKDDEKILFTQTIMGSNDNRIVTKSRIRKVVLVQGKEAQILQSKLIRNEQYTYRVINFAQNLDAKNNTLLVDKVKPVGDLLSVLGYPAVVTEKQAAKITKMLLSSDKEICTQKHYLRLANKELFDIDQIERANEQACDLNSFKSQKLPTEPQKIEKVYAKYFKK